MDGPQELLQGCTVALGRELDRAVVAVAHPTADPERPRAAHDEVAEADALHVAMNYRV